MKQKNTGNILKQLEFLNKYIDLLRILFYYGKSMVEKPWCYGEKKNMVLWRKKIWYYTEIYGTIPKTIEL